MTTPTSSRTTPTASDDERLAYVALALIEGLGPWRIAQLLSRFGSAVSAASTQRDALEGLDGIGPRLAAAIRRPPFERARELLLGAIAGGYRVLTPGDVDFPSQLRSIPDPPPILFVIGDAAVLSRDAVAIVGSRDHTRYGGEVAERLGTIAAEAGLVVVSGMARGLDALAQLAAIHAGGSSVGVLGTGIDIVYPASNRELYARIQARGAIVSEYPPGTRATKGSFPRRNRLISGLARALVVVEAADGSGTLITVSTALEQGRDVLAVPGPITSPTSRGTNRLLRDGAIPILDPADLLAALGLDAPAPGPPVPVEAPCTLSPVEARVLAALTLDGQSVDEVALAIGLPVGELLGALLGLELGGLVQQLPGMQYRRRTQ